MESSAVGFANCAGALTGRCGAPSPIAASSRKGPRGRRLRVGEQRLPMRCERGEDERAVESDAPSKPNDEATSSSPPLALQVRAEQSPGAATSASEHDAPPSAAATAADDKASQPRDSTPKRPRKERLATLEMFNFKVRVPGKLLLLSVPFLWGTFGPAVRFLYQVEHAPHPSVFNAERLSLSALVYVVVLAYQLRPMRGEERREAAKGVSSAAATAGGDGGSTVDKAVDNSSAGNRYTWIVGGVELGAYVFFATVFQVTGLQTVGAGRAAFLNQLQTVIVPLLAFLFRLEKSLPLSTWISSLIAVAGVSLLASNPSGDEAGSSMVGDSLEVLSAVCFSLYILRVGSYARKTRTPLLVGGKIVAQASFAWLWALQVIWSSQVKLYFVPDLSVADVASWAVVVLWTGLMTSALSGWLQTVGQKVVSASEAAVIFAMQPLVAAGGSWLLLREGLSTRALVGGALIVAATVVSSGGDNDADAQKSR